MKLLVILETGWCLYHVLDDFLRFERRNEKKNQMKIWKQQRQQKTPQK